MGDENKGLAPPAAQDRAASLRPQPASRSSQSGIAGAGFTPGPWRAHNGTYPDQPTVRIHRPDRTGGGIYTAVAYTNAGLPEANANARLIAAAPDLFEIVESLASFDARNSIVHLREMARAALSKVRAGEGE